MKSSSLYPSPLNKLKSGIFSKNSHLDPGRGEKINFIRQKILELYSYLYPVQVQKNLGPGLGQAARVDGSFFNIIFPTQIGFELKIQFSFH